MKVQKGIIARFVNAQPVFYDDDSFDRVRVIGRLIEGSGSRQLQSVESGRMISGMNVGMDEYDKRYKRCGPFMTGNVSSDVQLSWYVRAQTEKHCNGFVFDEGHLRAADLKRLGKDGDWFSTFLKDNMERLASVTCIAYVIRDVLKSGRTITRGYIITNEKGNLLGLRTMGESLKVREENSKVMSLATRIVTSQHMLADRPLVAWMEPVKRAKLFDEEIAVGLRDQFPQLPMMA